MKRIGLTIALMSALIFPFSLLSTQKTFAEETNLISNPSAETVDLNNQPVGWSQGNWGTNSASFFYNESAGQNGSKSLEINMTSWANGDAKWYFNPVNIEANAQYYFRDYYKANVPTEIVAEINDGNGNLSYLWIADIAQSESWKLSEHIFTAPQNSQTITIFHLIKSVGFLNVDNYLLKKATTTEIVNNVPNASLEQSTDTTPARPLEWFSNNWGTNKATFTYLNEGHTGTHSVKTQIRSYSSGDAKWYFTPQPVTPNQSYKFTDYYKSNISSFVVLAYTKLDGTMQYENLKVVGPTTTWTKYDDCFTVPSNATALTIFHLINSVGYLITDDYSIVPFEIQGFNRALISLTFDDSWETNITSAFPVLDQYGFKTTQYYATQFISTTEDKDAIKSIYNAGHEIGSHSVTHPFLTQVTKKKLNNELTKSKTFLESIVGTGNVKNFATPYGDYNFNVLSAISQYYQSNRNTDAGYNYKDNFDIYNIRVQNMTPTTTLAEFQSWIDKALNDNTWLVIIYHRVADDPEPYDVLPANFAAQMEYVYNSGITVKTVSAAINEILPQL